MGLEFWIVVVVVPLVVGAALAVFWMAPERRAHRALKRKAVPIGAAEVGRAQKVVGRVEAVGPMQEGLDGEPVVFAEIAVLHFFRRQREGSVSEAWKPVAEERRGDALAVVDDTGTVVVRPAGWTWMRKEQWYDVDWAAMPPPFAALIERHADAVRRDVPTKIRVRVLREGERVAVTGTLAEAEAQSYRGVVGAGGVFAVGEAAER